MTENWGPLPFTRGDLRSSLPAEAVARGEVYAQAGRVTILSIRSGGGLISARVAGSAFEPYQVTTYAVRRGMRVSVSGSCTCPVSADCKHVAAVLLAALQGSFTPAQSLGSAEAPTLVNDLALATRAQDSLVDFWLSRFRESVAGTRAEGDAGDERIAYVLSGTASSARRAFPVQIIVVRWAKTQRWTKVREMNVDTLASSNARAVGDDDAFVGRLLDAYEKSRRGRAQLAEEVLRRIVMTGRAYFERLDAAPLVIGPPRRARPVWTLGDDGTQRFELVFDDPALRLLVGGLTWYADPGGGVAGPIDAGIPSVALVALLGAPPLNPRQAAHVRETFNRGMPAELTLPAPLEIVERAKRVRPTPSLTLRSLDVPAAPHSMWGYAPAMAQTIDVAEFTFIYGSTSVDPASRDTEVRCVEAGEAVVYARAVADERRAAKDLQPYDFEHDAGSRLLVKADGLFLRFIGNDAARWAVFAHRTVPQLRAAGWQITIDQSFRHRVVDLADEAVWRTGIAASGDWFDLAIDLEVAGHRVALLPMLRDLMQRNDALGNPSLLASLGGNDAYYVTVNGLGATLAFPAERLKAIVGTLVELADPASLSDGGRLRLPRARANVVDELAAASGLRWDVPDRLRELADRLRAFSGVTRVAVPPSFVGELRGYQRDGLDWLQFLAAYGFGGILADDMGLGKSVQTLAHLLCEKEAGRLVAPALLVVPTSLVYNWGEEAARFTPSLRVLKLHGPQRARHFEEIAEHDLIITTYALLARDTVLRERTWHAVILDEAQALKNPQSKAALAAMGLRASHRLCLTGTPIENHLGDLWSLLSIALPGALGDRKQFGRLFRTPIEKHGDATRSRLLAQRIAPFVLRRTKEAVAKELPEKTEIVQRVELVGAQRDLYEAVRLAMQRRVHEEIASRGLARSQIVILDALLKLRQVCCDPRLLPERLRKTAESVKLDLLLEMLPQMIEEGRRVLVFSQFTSMLDLIAAALESRDISFVTLTGQTKDRASVVRSFQHGDVPVFLISLKAGGTGLNLTAADTVIHYDPWWNPAVERQATDRAHRIGQAQHIFVYKLIGIGTVEEKIVEMQSRKAELAAAIFAGSGATRPRFAAEDIERLFAPISADDAGGERIAREAASV